MQTTERSLPPLATRAGRHHKLDLSLQLAEGIRTLHFGPNRFSSTFCTHYVTQAQLVKFLARDELQQYADNGYATVPWNAKSLHQLALDVDRMQSKLLADLKGDLGGQADFEKHMQRVLDGDEHAEEA